MTQKQRLKQYLEAYGHIDPMQALRELGIYRLAARVLDLRAAGLHIQTRIVKVYTPTGTAKVARYELTR